ncbi:MAG: DUF853 family protein [Deltaproteobacteria bacterium]|nr:DUF853 family protein [Deltaproteobacteria bacterium]
MDLGRLRDTDRRYVVSPDDLTTHAVCVGMTGSGKTGLCVATIEELRRAGVPSLVIDSKGDLTNLALTFPELRPSDFVPWIDPAAAGREGASVDEFAERTARLWRDGLAGENLGGDDIRAMMAATPVAVYTPGSTAGRPLNVLSGLAHPGTDDVEIRADLIKSAVTGLLSLIGVSSDPLTGREFLLLANLVDYCWDRGEEASLPRLLSYIQNPPVKRIGFFAVDAFFPPDERVALAMRLNGLAASPGFEFWMTGRDLDAEGLLFDGDAPQCAVVCTAHLSEAERQFVTSLVLSRLAAWMRRQPGQGSLRALLFIDECAGLAPPYPKNPPTKGPLLTLFKQARAFGLGVLVATQNPVDLDYKVFGNAGLWMLGRLTTQGDRRRVVEGLRGVAGMPENLEAVLAELPKRHFLMRNLHRPDAPVVKSRFVMSYLRGPMTSADIERLSSLTDSDATAAQVTDQPATATPSPVGEYLVQPPVVEGLRHYFLQPEALRETEWAELFGRFAEGASEVTTYAPALYQTFHVRFDETAADLTHDEVVARIVYPLERPDDLKYNDEEALHADLSPFLLDAPTGPARFLPLPEFLDEAVEFQRVEKDVAEAIYRGRTLPIFHHPALKLYSRVGEGEEAFRVRCGEAAEQVAHEKFTKEQAGLQSKIERLAERLDRVGARLADAQTEAQSRRMETMVGVLESAAGLFFGRRRSVSAAVSRGLSKRRMSERAKLREEKYRDESEDLAEQIEELRDEIESRASEIEAEYNELAQRIETREIRLERGDIRVDLRAIVWVPLV